MPDEERAQLIREAYRTLGPAAAALMAQWMSEPGESEALEEVKVWLAESTLADEGEDSDAMGQGELLAELQPFFERRIDADGDIDPEIARRATEHFMELYHHAAPFDGDNLIRIWGSCREGHRDPEWCAEWAHGEAKRVDSKPEATLLNECMSSRYVGDRCREGLAEARQIVETGRAVSLEE